ncbi:hypothetical protein DL767_001406 [Monosporascus sp. MG133]|nr:hypothetical protein DL767_001406 [Monosporascus sp. MG133]
MTRKKSNQPMVLIYWISYTDPLSTATDGGMAESKKFNVGVIGYGLSAKVFNIPFITTTPAFNLHSILQRKPTPESSAPNDYPQLKHFTSLDDFLADSSLDVVVVTTPPETHFPFVRQALEAGRHVMVEKPFVPSSAEADMLLHLAREKGRLLCVYQNRRWDGDFLTVRKLVSEGTLGRVVELDTHFDLYRPEKPSPTSWKTSLGLEGGGTAIYDLGTHLIDQAYALFGPPRSVFAKFASQRDGALSGPAANNDELDIDSVTAHLYYDSGLVVNVRIGVLSAEARQPRFWVRGSRGSYRKFGMDPQEGQLRAADGPRPGDARYGREGAEWSGRLAVVGRDGNISESDCPTVEPQTYGRIYELFGEALRSGKEEDVPVPASQARDVLKIIEAAKESAKSGTEVEVRL